MMTNGPLVDHTVQTRVCSIRPRFENGLDRTPGVQRCLTTYMLWSLCAVARGAQLPHPHAASEYADNPSIPHWATVPISRLYTTHNTSFLLTITYVRPSRPLKIVTPHTLQTKWEFQRTEGAYTITEKHRLAVPPSRSPSSRLHLNRKDWAPACGVFSLLNCKYAS